MYILYSVILKTLRDLYKQQNLSSCSSTKQTVRTGPFRPYSPYGLHSSLHIRKKKNTNTTVMEVL
jgi:hypothetical protein